MTYIPTAPASIVAMLNSPALAQRGPELASHRDHPRCIGGGRKELLYQHPKIVQAAIVGAPDPRLGRA